MPLILTFNVTLTPMASHCPQNASPAALHMEATASQADLG